MLLNGKSTRRSVCRKSGRDLLYILCILLVVVSAGMANADSDDENDTVSTDDSEDDKDTDSSEDAAETEDTTSAGDPSAAEPGDNEDETGEDDPVSKEGNPNDTGSGDTQAGDEGEADPAESDDPEDSTQGSDGSASDKDTIISANTSASNTSESQDSDEKKDEDSNGGKKEKDNGKSSEGSAAAAPAEPALNNNEISEDKQDTKKSSDDTDKDNDSKADSDNKKDTDAKADSSGSVPDTSSKDDDASKDENGKEKSPKDDTAKDSSSKDNPSKGASVTRDSGSVSSSTGSSTGTASTTVSSTANNKSKYTADTKESSGGNLTTDHTSNVSSQVNASVNISSNLSIIRSEDAEFLREFRDSTESGDNIEFRDYSFASIVRGQEALFRFGYEENVVTSVSFMPAVSGGHVRTVVEILKGTSTLIREHAPGMVYRNFNIWVGDAEFSPQKITDARVSFKVEKEWLTSNDIDSGTMVLYTYINGWNSLSTEITGEDEEYVYYTAQTPGFSLFAIASTEDSYMLTGDQAGKLPAAREDSGIGSSAAASGKSEVPHYNTYRSAAILLVSLLVAGAVGMAGLKYMARPAGNGSMDDGDNSDVKN
ncbi:PGF-pre-PGF domain-containing protein [Methanolobus chelungpuianus]|uniref:PGF-pre-PGF domain-containing protein n=1 Tax=Methanolobus chelungpuianus TaxID=502115 RepID=UPI002114F786|nr:PGF-pre-PGF domain-containing protein [Methanolobus chelungpuianus]